MTCDHGAVYDLLICIVSSWPYVGLLLYLTGNCVKSVCGNGLNIVNIVLAFVRRRLSPSVHPPSLGAFQFQFRVCGSAFFVGIGHKSEFTTGKRLE